MNCNYLGSVPLDPRLYIYLNYLIIVIIFIKFQLYRLARSCDEGESFLSKYEESHTAIAINKIVEGVLEQLK